ncbi:hypothetical protein [Peptoniphilus hominis (ex Hitch et al. 2025)]|uniref:Uncharacterized protein n=1 Tax=Peptoniphilus hominis (ex Hitch et al. 2025) TaxID=3133174 RepID=A0ABV1CEQ5_9FIRM
MTDLKEIKEAREALLDLREEIDSVINMTDSASRWSLFDIFAGSSIVGFVKRGKIKDINSGLEIIREKLEIAKKELGDVRMSLDEEISDTTYDFFVDIIFDNIFTDLRVNREIKEIRENLFDLKERVEEILRKLN